MLQTTAELPTKITAREYIDAEKEGIAALARESFYDFRRLIRPDMTWGWWPRCVCMELQQFYQDMQAGKRPKLAMMAPPQHGKSWAATDFIAWVAGKNPDLKTIFGSYSADLGVRTNLDIQRIIKSPNYQLAFPLTQIGQFGWVCNTELIEFVGWRGSFRNTTVEGAINGMELHLGVIDDPVKGRAEANSQLVRDRTWNWFVDDFMSRMSKDNAVLIIMTRWHVDDLLGRFIERYPDVKVLRYPAIAEKATNYRPAGGALFPELKPLDFLLERKQLLTEASWQSIYQQSPIVVGGGVFPVDKLKVLPFWDRKGIKRSCRYWDKAGTEREEAAFTCGVVMHWMLDGRFVVEHVARGKWGALEREQEIKAWAERDRSGLSTVYEVVVEQEPGSGGKESAEATIRNLAGYRVFADKVTGAKEVRAEPFAAQVQGGNVWLVAGQWHYAYLEELENFPASRFMDQVDASSGAFNRLTGTPASTIWMPWLD
jgi:predicted phage terminase large subunit-like protein